MNQNNEKQAAIYKDFERLAGLRGNWESHWQEIAQRAVPNQWHLFTNGGINSSKGEKRNEYIFDSTAAIALQRFGSILDSFLTPRNQTWHHLRPSDSSLQKSREVMLYFEEVNRILLKHRYAAAANFSGQNQLDYLSLGAFGTSCMFIDGMRDFRAQTGLRYRNVHLGEVFFAENHQGIVDKVYRRFNMTGRQLMQKFESKIPDNIKTKISSNGEQEFEVLHCVKHRDEGYDESRKDFRGRPFSSEYILKEGFVQLEEGGYTSFPYIVSRYEQSPGEVYGRSPAMQVLPAIKTLNEQKKTVLKQGQRTVDPILLAHDDGILDGFSMKPGALNSGGVNADGRALVQALPVGNIAIGKDLMDDERAIINDAFLVTLFQILLETPAMTATEVIERTREKGILIAPTLGRQQTEKLGPTIERELDLLARQGRLPPMPRILVEAKGEYRIEYDSPISRAQKAEEASGGIRAIETTLNIVNATGDNSYLNHFNFDEMIPDMSLIHGVPTKWMNPVEKVMQIKQAQAQAAQDAQMIEAAPAAAGIMKAQATIQKGK